MIKLLKIFFLCVISLYVLTAKSDNSTYSAMYFQSQVRDAPYCSMEVSDTGSINFAKNSANPAANCPDAFAWKQFLDAVSGEFWTQWANDETVWVSNPKPLCSNASENDCCFVDSGKVPLVGYRNSKGKKIPPSNVGGPGEFCPYIPGDYGGSNETSFAGAKPITSHNTTFLRSQDPALIARQREAEVVYRNNSFVEYTTSKEMYSRAGLSKLFNQVAGEAKNSRPYRPLGQGAAYPADALMFKVDWVPEATMLELGYIADIDNDPSTPPQDPDNPYVTMQINAAHGSDTPFQQGLYYLVAITGASKALPSWHWYVFEHVNNLGRCDYNGCNDSYGYSTMVSTPDPTNANQEIVFNSNFITPNTESSQLRDGVSLFDLGKRYPSGNISNELALLFKKTRVGYGSKPVDPKMPKAGDPAWRSYRMKGTQTAYYNNDGSATVLGSSTEEGGFDNTSSCMSCHVQASVDAQGAVGVPGIGFNGRLSLSGIPTVVNGHPNISDYYDRGTTQQRAVRVDMVWGILFAK